MKPRHRNLSILPMLGALAVFSFSFAPAAWAGDSVQDAVLQEDAARALQRGEEMVQKGDFQRAAAEFERASELQGGPCPECLLGVARAYSGARQYDAGLQMTRMALALFSSPQDKARAYDQLGSLLALKGDMEAARAAFGKAVQLDGQIAEQVRSSLAEALMKRASYAQAVARPAGAQETAAEVTVRNP
jgi:tetratricopeptide (TPR) repeat protein